MPIRSAASLVIALIKLSKADQNVLEARFTAALPPHQD
jgi:hypothetical protein